MLAARPSAAAASNGPRLAAIDWAMLETAIAIGHMPVAACELIRYRSDTPEPRIPDRVIDLGLRGSPNYELLQLSRPDLILNSPYYSHYEARLKAIAPVFTLPFYVPNEPPLPKALAALGALAEALNDPGAGARALAQTQAELDHHAGVLTPFDDRSICLVNIGDARHLRAFGYDSLFGNTLTRLGLSNAWSAQTAFSFLAPVPVERLADLPDARLVLIGQIPPEARRGLSRSVLWQALPAVKEGRVYHLPEINAFGGTPSALRFARLLAQALQQGPATL